MKSSNIIKRMAIGEALKQQKKILESQGYTVAYIALYGSQNYSLDVMTDEYQSDIDIKAIVVPSLDDLIENSKPVSKVVDTEWGQCDVKDIRSYFQTLLKANPAYLETLFTDYYIVDDKFVSEFSEINARKDDLVFALRAQMIRAMYGMMCEKEKALKHPYPSIAHKIEKFGYDGKQASHVLRLYMLMYDYYINSLPLKEALVPQEDTDLMMALKLNKIPLEEAELIVKELMEKGKKLRDYVLEGIDEVRIDYSIKDKFLKLSQEIIKYGVISKYE